jgi:hypothetical protein
MLRTLIRWLLGSPRTCAAENCDHLPAHGRYCLDHATAANVPLWRG